MLTGRPPFDGATPLAIAEAQAAGPPALSDVEPPLADAVRRSLAVDPAARFPDVAAFGAAVEAAVPPAAASDATRVVPAVVPAVVPKMNALDDLPRIAGSNRRPAVAIGALVIALGLAGLVAFVALDQPRSPGGDAVQLPSQEATAAPSAPATDEPVVNAGGKANGGGGGKDGSGKGKGRDDNGTGKGKGRN
jgi:serine/threonine-protein kinase